MVRCGRQRFVELRTRAGAITEIEFAHAGHDPEIGNMRRNRDAASRDLVSFTEAPRRMQQRCHLVESRRIRRLLRKDRSQQHLGIVVRSGEPQRGSKLRVHDRIRPRAGRHPQRRDRIVRPSKHQQGNTEDVRCERMARLCRQNPARDLLRLERSAASHRSLGLLQGRVDFCEAHQMSSRQTFSGRP